MACEGGECKVQIFDVHVDMNKVKIVKTVWYSGAFVQQDPSEKYCKKPTAEDIANALRKKPKWLAECPNPKPPEKPTCQCIFIKDDLDPKKGWTSWVQYSLPKDEIDLGETLLGPDASQTRSCKHKLSGTYQESSKILHGACMDSSEKGLPKEMKDALDQRNPEAPGN